MCLYRVRLELSSGKQTDICMSSDDPKVMAACLAVDFSRPQELECGFGKYLNGECDNPHSLPKDWKPCNSTETVEIIKHVIEGDSEGSATKPEDGEGENGAPTVDADTQLHQEDHAALWNPDSKTVSLILSFPWKVNMDLIE